MHKKVLIVDDDLDILEALKLTFEAEGYSAQTITKGEQTYAVIAAFKPDVVILDILLSGKDGRTICKKLKNDEKTSALPIIMISAQPGAHKSTQDVGADDFLAKPFDTDVLIAKVNALLL